MPFGNEQAPQVLYPYKIVGRLAGGSFFSIIYIIILGNVKDYLNINTPNEVRKEAMVIHIETDFTLFSFRVDCPARTLLGCT